MNKFIFTLIILGLLPFISCNNAGNKNSNEKMNTKADDNSIDQIESNEDDIDERNAEIDERYTEIEAKNVEIAGKVDDFLMKRKLRLEQKIRFYDFEFIQRKFPTRDLLGPRTSNEIQKLSEVSYESAKNEFNDYTDEVDRLDFIEMKYKPTYATKGHPKNSGKQKTYHPSQKRQTRPDKRQVRPDKRQVRPDKRQIRPDKRQVRPLPPDYSWMTQDDLDKIYKTQMSAEVIDAVSSIQDASIRTGVIYELVLSSEFADILKDYYELSDFSSEEILELKDGVLYN